MEITEIYNKLKDKFGDSVKDLIISPPSDAFIAIASDKLFDICLELRDNPEFDFDYLMCISAVDFSENLEVVYHIYSMNKKHKVILKVSVPKENPVVPSIERIWRSADWHEREAYDLLGVVFEGHHNLIRILLPYDWEGHPLRKDYKEPETYHGMKVPY
ncbi:MAG: NADH-quinone oxidoreductase subunit C [Ignavibacteria bacterium]|nr:NADH-quinone oxidoreductase subunit C [Ignavibacteria bacterium]